MTGTDRDARHRHAADLGEHRGGVVAAPAARPGDDQHQVGVGRRPAQLSPASASGSSGYDRADHGHRAELHGSARRA